MMNYPNVVSKLGLVEHAPDETLFRRITPAQLKASGAEFSLQYLKKQAILLFTKEKVKLDDYDVFFTYNDPDGDLVIIETAEDLTAALEEYTDAGKITILAQVRAKRPESPSEPTESPFHFQSGAFGTTRGQGVGFNLS